VEKPHKKLDLWKLAMEVVTDVYRVTEFFPTKESFGLISQIRRAAVSVPSNIAEGAARQTKKEFTQFLYIARGSLSELDTQLDLAMRLAFLNQRDLSLLDEKMERVDKMINGLILKKKAPSVSRFTSNEKRT